MTKALDIANKILKYGIFSVGAVLIVIHFINPDLMPKAWQYLATMALVFLFDLMRMCGMKISAGLEFWYYIFIIPAMILGIDFNLYKIIYPLDKIVHFCSGLLTARGAKEIWDQCHIASEKKLFKPLFIMCFVAFIAVLWECFEFSCDQILGQSMQQLIVPGVSDTMWDMIVALMGGFLYTTLVHPSKKRSS